MSDSIQRNSRPRISRRLAGAVAGFALAATWPSAALAAALDDDGMVAATPSLRAGMADKESAAETEHSALGKKVGDYLKTVHGEVGAVVGTDGTRAVYGTAVLPLGEDSSLTVSFESGRTRSYGGWGYFGGTPYYGAAPVYGLGAAVRSAR